MGTPRGVSGAEDDLPEDVAAERADRADHLRATVAPARDVAEHEREVSTGDEPS